MTFFTHDCFHFTIKGHEELAKGVWNNMVNAIDQSRWRRSIHPLILFLSVFLLVSAWGRKDDREQFFRPHRAHLSIDGRRTAAAEHLWSFYAFKQMHSNASVFCAWQEHPYIFTRPLSARSAQPRLQPGAPWRVSVASTLSLLVVSGCLGPA